MLKCWFYRVTNIWLEKQVGDCFSLVSYEESNDLSPSGEQTEMEAKLHAVVYMNVLNKFRRKWLTLMLQLALLEIYAGPR